MKVSTRIKEEYMGMPVEEYSLENDNGYKINILSFGATISEIFMPSQDGSVTNILMNYLSCEHLVKSWSYSGCTLAPNAGRISGAAFEIDGTTYELTKNDGDNNIHGGFDNASLKNWTLENTVSDDTRVSIKLTYTLEDGVDGYPGNRKLATTFELNNDNQLTIQYFAETDKATYLNLSNHMYFNLAGMDNAPAISQHLMINADKYIANNKEFLPFEVRSVKNTAFDFTNLTKMSANIETYNEDDQLKMGGCYNNGFVCNSDTITETPDLVIYDSESKRKVELYSETDGIVIFSGNKSGIAIEPQDCPNAPNSGLSTYNILRPGEKYSRKLIYKFSAN